MSARAQVLVEDSGIYLYDHHGAESDNATVSAVHSAISRRERWEDPEYLAAIIFREMIKGDMDGNASFGIGTGLNKDTQLLVTVNCDSKTITTTQDSADDEEVLGRHEVRQDIRPCSFEDFARTGSKALLRSRTK